MAEFRTALNEVYATQNKVILFMTFLRALIVFLLSFIILSMFNFFQWGLAIAIAMIYFAVKLHKEIDSKNLTEIERRNPFLAEKLRTAADYANIVNYVVSRLHASVLNSLKNVPISSFIDLKKVTYLLFMIILSSGAVLFVVSNDIMIYDLRAALASLSLQGNKDVLEGLIPNSLLEADISIEDLNDNALVNEMAMSAKKEKEKRDLYLPEDLFEQSDKSFEEMLPKKKRIYIRKYFGEIRKYGFE